MNILRLFRRRPDAHELRNLPDLDAQDHWTAGKLSPRIGRTLAAKADVHAWRQRQAVRDAEAQARREEREARRKWWQVFG